MADNTITSPTLDSNADIQVHYGLPDMLNAANNEEDENETTGREPDRPTDSQEEDQEGEISTGLSQINIGLQTQEFNSSVLTSDQGLYSRTCTCHAIAKCICGSFPRDGLDAQILADCLNQIFKDMEGTFADEYNGKSIKITKQNIPGSFLLKVEKCDIQHVNPTEKNQFLIWYEHEDVHHSIYVKRCGGNCFVCVDSFGNDMEKYIPKHLVRQAYRVEAWWMRDVDVKEPTIDKLSFGDIQLIAQKLDQNDSWHRFGMQLVEQLGIMEKKEVDNLHLHIHGGGSPAHQFLEELAVKKYHLRVEDFCNLAGNLKRLDIFHAMKKWEEGEEKLLKDISDENRKVLAGLLNKRMIISADWRMFADALDFSMDDIDRIGKSIRMPGEYSPSEKLLRSLQKKAPYLQMFCIRTLLQGITRNDIVEVVNEISQRHKENIMKDIVKPK